MERDYEKRFVIRASRKSCWAGLSTISSRRVSHANGTTQRLVICIICFPFYLFFPPPPPFDRHTLRQTLLLHVSGFSNVGYKILRAHFHSREKPRVKKKKEKNNRNPYIINNNIRTRWLESKNSEERERNKTSIELFVHLYTCERNETKRKATY